MPLRAPPINAEHSMESPRKSFGIVASQQQQQQQQQSSTFQSSNNNNNNARPRPITTGTMGMTSSYAASSAYNLLNGLSSAAIRGGNQSSSQQQHNPIAAASAALLSGSAGPATLLRESILHPHAHGYAAAASASYGSARAQRQQLQTKTKDAFAARASSASFQRRKSSAGGPAATTATARMAKGSSAAAAAGSSTLASSSFSAGSLASAMAKMQFQSKLRASMSDPRIFGDTVVPMVGNVHNNSNNNNTTAHHHIGAAVDHQGQLQQQQQQPTTGIALLFKTATNKDGRRVSPPFHVSAAMAAAASSALPLPPRNVPSGNSARGLGAMMGIGVGGPVLPPAALQQLQEQQQPRIRKLLLQQQQAEEEADERAAQELILAQQQQQQQAADGAEEEGEQRQQEEAEVENQRARNRDDDDSGDDDNHRATTGRHIRNVAATHKVPPLLATSATQLHRRSGGPLLPSSPRRGAGGVGTSVGGMIMGVHGYGTVSATDFLTEEERRSMRPSSGQGAVEQQLADRQRVAELRQQLLLRQKQLEEGFMTTSSSGYDHDDHRKQQSGDGGRNTNNSNVSALFVGQSVLKSDMLGGSQNDGSSAGQQQHQQQHQLPARPRTTQMVSRLQQREQRAALVSGFQMHQQQVQQHRFLSSSDPTGSSPKTDALNASMPFLYQTAGNTEIDAKNASLLDIMNNGSFGSQQLQKEYAASLFNNNNNNSQHHNASKPLSPNMSPQRGPQQQHQQHGQRQLVSPPGLSLMDKVEQLSPAEQTPRPNRPQSAKQLSELFSGLKGSQLEAIDDLRQRKSGRPGSARTNAAAAATASATAQNTLLTASSSEQQHQHQQQQQQSKNGALPQFPGHNGSAAPSGGGQRNAAAGGANVFSGFSGGTLPSNSNNNKSAEQSGAGESQQQQRPDPPSSSVAATSTAAGTGTGGAGGKGGRRSSPKRDGGEGAGRSSSTGRKPSPTSGDNNNNNNGRSSSSRANNNNNNNNTNNNSHKGAATGGNNSLAGNLAMGAGILRLADPPKPVGQGKVIMHEWVAPSSLLAAPPPLPLAPPGAAGAASRRPPPPIVGSSSAGPPGSSNAPGAAPAYGTRMSPAEALAHYDSSRLTRYEKMEILEYDDIYFVGAPKANKVQAPIDGAVNFGYDDERGEYVLVPGDHIAFRYEIKDLLGKGSFGSVSRVFDHKRQQMCAAKVIRNKKRFLHQAQIEIRVLDHLRTADVEEKSCCVKMLNYFQFRNHVVITFELHALNLYELTKLNKHMPFPMQLIRRFAGQLLVCLAFLAKEKILHADLKPENILLRQENKTGIRVIDFGSSCYEGDASYQYIQSRFYRAPEVILHLPYGRPMDAWSLGCILAEMQLGYPLFSGENEKEQIQCFMEVLGLPPPRLLERSPRKAEFFDPATNAPKITPNSKGKTRRPASSNNLRATLGTADELFVDFIRRFLMWDAEERMTPEQGMQHPWIADLFASGGGGGGGGGGPGLPMTPRPPPTR